VIVIRNILLVLQLIGGYWKNGKKERRGALFVSKVPKCGGERVKETEVIVILERTDLKQPTFEQGYLAKL